MKIHIVFPFKQGPWGGGNQFLTALKEIFRARGIFAKSPEDANVILFNSHHSLSNIVSLRAMYPNCVFVHRVDGPLTLVRGGGIRNRMIDRAIFSLTRSIADVTIFQSQWSKDQATQFGYRPRPFDTIIHNACNKEIFFPKTEGRDRRKKISLIMTSWSANMNKGFAMYSYLDQHLDFSKYDCTFIGNTPVSFSHIRVLPPVSSEDIATYLREADIFVTASRHDPCSNALIEALSVGLPAVALNDGGHPELVQKGGVIFHNIEDILQSIDTVAENYAFYRQQVPLFSIENVAENYVAVMEKCLGEPMPVQRTHISFGTWCVLYLLGKYNKQG